VHACVDAQLKFKIQRISKELKHLAFYLFPNTRSLGMEGVKYWEIVAHKD